MTALLEGAGAACRWLAARGAQISLTDWHDSNARGNSCGASHLHFYRPNTQQKRRQLVTLDWRREFDYLPTETHEARRDNQETRGNVPVLSNDHGDDNWKYLHRIFVLRLHEWLVNSILLFRLCGSVLCPTAIALRWESPLSECSLNVSRITQGNEHLRCQTALACTTSIYTPLKCTAAVSIECLPAYEKSISEKFYYISRVWRCCAAVLMAVFRWTTASFVRKS